MKTFYVKKGKGAKPVVGASILSKKPKVGSYISFNVPTDVKIPCTMQGGFSQEGITLTGNLGLENNGVYINCETIGGDDGLDFSGLNLFFSQAPYNQIQTVDQLLEMTNRRMGGMLYFVLEDGIIYVTKNGLSTPIDSITIGAGNW